MGNGPQFFETMMGRKFYERDVPNIAKSLDKIAVALGKGAELANKEEAVLKVKINENTYLKVCLSNTDNNGVCVDIVKGDEETPFLLVEGSDEEGKVSAYIWEDEKDEDFTKKIQVDL